MTSTQTLYYVSLLYILNIPEHHFSKQVECTQGIHSSPVYITNELDIVNVLELYPQLLQTGVL